MNPFGNFSVGKSAARAHSQLPEDETATCKKPKFSSPSGSSAMIANSPSIKTEETTVKKSITSAPAVPSLFASGVGADANASRAFFGLSESDFKTRSSSLFSSIPSAAPAQKTPGSIFQFTPSKETAAGDQTTSSWFSSMRPSRQDTNAANTTSFFSSLPQTTIGAGSAFSKTSVTKPFNDKETNNQPDGLFAFKTAGAASKITPQGQVQSKKDGSDVSSMRIQHRNIFGVVPGTSSLGSGLAKSDSKMSNEPLTTQSVMKSSLTGQGDAPGYQRPSQLFSKLTAGLLEPNNIASNKAPTNPTVNAVHKDSYKPASHVAQQSSQSARHAQESTKRINPSKLMSAKKVDPLQCNDTPNASIFGKVTVAASDPVPPAFKCKTKSSLFPSTGNIQGERQGFMRLHHTKKDKASGADEQLRTTPLISLTIKEISEANAKTPMFPQYTFLGCRIPESSSSHEEDIASSTTHSMFGSTNFVDEESEPILLNTNTPWSAFICGSQGSGKSYTLSAIIENCLYASPTIGKLPKPLAGVVFHNNTASAHNICEAAQLVSLGVKVNVLVSRSNYHTLSTIYKKAVGSKHEKLLNIQPLVLQSHHITAEGMHRLMAFAEGETAVPLYMEVIMRILREMAITGVPFSYATFKDNLDKEGLQPAQKVMMAMRLNLLESFLDPSCIETSKKAHSKNNDILSTSPGTLTIVDLSDPFLDSGTTCTLFDILLSVFLSSRPVSGLLVCLDEAHKFMRNTPAAETFTENLLTVIREQRHNACRVVVATQEPTISPKLLDLCSMTFVHRFTSPDWMTTLREHLAGASDLVTAVTSAGDKDGGSVGDRKQYRAAALFERIINLDVGESLLFAPSAALELDENGKQKKLGVGCVKFKTRSRLGADGGQSILAVRE
ncbi:hypothetical protein KCU85_g7574, partial [Aureobasidium melanogenum]